MPRAYINYLAKSGLKVTIKYVRHAGDLGKPSKVFGAKSARWIFGGLTNERSLNDWLYTWSLISARSGMWIVSTIVMAN
jgi:hypothetical protein